MKNSQGVVYYIIRVYKFALTFRAQSKINKLGSDEGKMKTYSQVRPKTEMKIHEPFLFSVSDWSIGFEFNASIAQLQP